MLRELHVRNLAVVASASLELGSGLNALTGETGAGKSIVVDSLLLLAGDRASDELIRTGADSLTVSAIFEPEGSLWHQALAEAGLEAEGDELLVRREVNRSGRNRVFINDQPATLRLLSALAPSLLRIHGQRDELGLSSPELQRDWLDRSAGRKAQPLRKAVAEAYERWEGLAARLERLQGDRRAREERLDILRFQAGEIDAVELLAGEEEGLRAERESLRHRESITAGLAASISLLVEEEGAAAERTARAQAHLEEIAAWEKAAKEWATEAEELRIRLEELARDLSSRFDAMEADPQRLNQVEERLAQVERLCRKYGGTTELVLERRDEIAAELSELEGDLEGQEELVAATQAALEDYRKAALELSRARARWGKTLCAAVHRELAGLKLEKARLDVRLEHRRRGDSPLLVGGEAIEFGPLGIDHVVYGFAANPGEDPRPLARIASGGELSRLSLALQLATRDAETAAGATLIFDEVDSGIGGAEAAALGEKLQRLASQVQILAVTHLPQVASYGDTHFKVSKSQKQGRTFTRVEPLLEGDRVAEIARMLAGSEITDLSRSHAHELLAGAARGGG